MKTSYRSGAMEHVLKMASAQFTRLNDDELEMLHKIYERDKNRDGWYLLTEPPFLPETPNLNLEAMVTKQEEMLVAYHVSDEFTFTVCHILFNGNLYCGVAKRCNYNGREGMCDRPDPQLGRLLAFRRALLSAATSTRIPKEASSGSTIT